MATSYLCKIRLYVSAVTEDFRKLIKVVLHDIVQNIQKWIKNSLFSKIFLDLMNFPKIFQIFVDEGIFPTSENTAFSKDKWIYERHQLSYKTLAKYYNFLFCMHIISGQKAT